jgi:hypothetical protein
LRSGVKDVSKVHYFHAEASSLGGFIDKPNQKAIPCQASASLPAVGGHATNRTEAFNFEGVVSCTSAYSRVSGRHLEEDGSPSTLVTSVIEGFNLLEVVTADRIVAQISMEHPAAGGPPIVSFTGSRFEGLKIGGHDASLTLNSSLLEGGGGAAAREQINWPLFQKTGRQQAAKLVKSAKSSGDTYQWVVDRYGWMVPDREPETPESILCSLVDGVDPAVPGKSFGHVLQIPNFGKVIFGEVLAFPAAVHLSMIRAELGSPTSGALSIGSVKGNGGTYPP